MPEWLQQWDASLGPSQQTSPPANGWSAGDLVCLSVQQENELPSTAVSPAPLFLSSAWQSTQSTALSAERACSKLCFPLVGPLGTVTRHTAGSAPRAPPPEPQRLQVKAPPERSDTPPPTRQRSLLAPRGRWPLTHTHKVSGGSSCQPTHTCSPPSRVHWS